MSRLRETLDRGVGALLAVLMAAAVVNVVWQIASRYLLGDPSSFTDELARYLLVWLGLTGAAYAAGQGQHAAVDVLPRGLSAATERMLAIAMHAAIFVFATSVMIVGGIRLVSLSIELGQRSAALGLPMGLVYLAVPISGAVIALYSVCFAAGAWTREASLDDIGEGGEA